MLFVEHTINNFRATGLLYRALKNKPPGAHIVCDKKKVVVNNFPLQKTIAVMTRMKVETVLQMYARVSDPEDLD